MVDFADEENNLHELKLVDVLPDNSGNTRFADGPHAGKQREQNSSGNLIVPSSNRQTGRNKQGAPVGFDRNELSQLLRVYGFRVASGEWRDYAIDMLKDRAVFSVFRRSSEMPLYMIEKNPKLRKKQGAWSIINANGLVLKRGQELTQVLRYFEKKPKLVAV